MRYFSALIWLFLSNWLCSQETILDYQVEISILSNSKIEVTEEITVRAEGNQIRRGIYRIIPTIRPDKAGRSEPAPIEILSVQRDGQEEEYHTEKSREEITIYFGQESVILSPGVYTYEMRYLASNQIGYFDDYDELYWNVIGADWAFPIQDYGVTIHLPEGADYLQGSCYTGRPGSTSSDCMISSGAVEGVVISRSDKGLRPGEGFTVAVAWPKGFVEEGSSSSYSLNWVNLLLFLGGLVLFWLYGYRLWKKVGIDPPESTIVPAWSPPGSYSPAELSYLNDRKITDAAISAALISGAIKGAIRIENKKKKFTFHRIGEPENLEQEESALIDQLLPPGTESFELNTTNYTAYNSAKTSFSTSLKNKLKIGDYFHTNWKESIFGCLLLAVVTTLTLSIGMYALKNFGFLLLFVLLIFAYLGISLPFRMRKWYKWLIIIPMWLISTLVIVGIYTQGLYYSDDYIWIGIIVGSTILLAGWFSYLIYAPTIKGQQTSAEVQGFRMYLERTEKAMLDYFTPPEKTPELFEKMLPFAIALGVENRWGRKFKSVLDLAIERGTYAPIWYTGNIHQINTLHSNFQSSVAHAAPKSSSGSGGGGFSGGGGGGGGGGGW